jgi:Protein of unknown function (DUF3303)
MKRYMIIERFDPGNRSKIYDRFHTKGRMLPPGLLYIDSWLAGDGASCFQLMEAADYSLFTVWIQNWKDLMEFEIVELGDKPKRDA